MVRTSNSTLQNLKKKKRGKKIHAKSHEKDK